MVLNRHASKWATFLSTGLVLFSGITPELGIKPAHSAEKLVFPLAIFGDFSVSIDSLALFAKEGQIAPDLAFYTNRLDSETVGQLREMLRKRYEVNPVTVSNFLKRGMGEALLKRLGQLVQMEGNIHGYYALRSSLILAAADPVEGLTLINVMKHFPRRDIRLNTDLLFALLQEFNALLEYREAAVRAVSQQADREAKEAKAERPQSLELPDLRQRGTRNVEKISLNFQIEDIRPTQAGLAPSYPLEVDFYLPDHSAQPAPLVIISHGFGSYPGNYQIAEHLASHGFAVAIPRHLGSDLAYRQALLRGKARLDVSPVEYLSRPWDIIHLLDRLERLVASDPAWTGRVNLQQVGVLGHSLGGTTAFSLAGAALNLARLEEECQQDRVILNPALLLQCRANYLPPGTYRQQDPRIKAIIAVHPLTSSIFGPEGLRQVTIPTLMVAGSEDLVAPVVEEQIHPFIWLNANPKYLSLLVPGTHFSTTIQPDGKGVEGMPEFLLGNNADLGRPYLQGLSVAFFEVYLGNRQEYLPYLSAAYAQKISQERLEVKMIQSLSPEQLESNYAATPPTAIIPQPVLSQIPKQKESILVEIQRTGVLKAAVRQDAPPFGYVSSQGEWTGYCIDFLQSFAEYLKTKYSLDVPVEVVKISSNLSNRFNLVAQEKVHLECGPNTIRKNLKNISFSNLFFVTGTQFLVKEEDSDTINPNLPLTGESIGVLRNTTTEDFIEKRYPDGKKIYFEGVTGSREAVQAVVNGEIDIFANDGILSVGQVVQQNLDLDRYALIPRVPLTCDFYGMILPSNDPQWLKAVNGFIESQENAPLWNKWFDRVFPYVLLDLDYCVNR